MKLSDFDKIVCLAVDRRKDTDWSRVQQLVESRGGHVDFYVVGDGKLLPKTEYDRINTEVPSYFCGFPNSFQAFRAFQDIVHRSFAAGIRNILLLEDDVDFTEDFDRVLATVSDQLARNSLVWDVLYLGANHSFSPTYEVSENILRVAGSLCFHAIALSDRVFPSILEWQPTHPIDLVAARMLHNHFACYSVWPNIAVQRAGFSNVEGRYRDYSDFLLSRGNPFYSKK